MIFETVIFFTHLLLKVFVPLPRSHTAMFHLDQMDQVSIQTTQKVATLSFKKPFHL